MRDFVMIGKWGVLKDEEGNILYRGILHNGKPSGAGTAYFPDGGIYQTGVFGIKGLLVGREYYPNGVLRFEGVYRLNNSYGPNYPQTGRFFSREGELLLEGEADTVRSGVEYDRAEQKEKPDIAWLMWRDVDFWKPGKPAALQFVFCIRCLLLLNLQLIPGQRQPIQKRIDERRTR